MSEQDETTHTEWSVTQQERYAQILEQWKEQREEIKRLRAIIDGRAELARVRDEIRLRSEVLRGFLDDVVPNSPEGIECGKQHARFMELLRRERELMGKEWVTE